MKEYMQELKKLQSEINKFAPVDILTIASFFTSDAQFENHIKNQKAKLNFLKSGK